MTRNATSIDDHPTAGITFFRPVPDVRPDTSEHPPVTPDHPIADRLSARDAYPRMREERAAHMKRSNRLLERRSRLSHRWLTANAYGANWQMRSYRVS